MAKNKNAASTELEALVKKLRSNLEKAEAKAESWKKKARQHESAVSRAKAEVARLEKKLKKPAKSAEPGKSAKPGKSEKAARTATPARTTATSTAPDASWTVVRLRAAAREKGVPGYSRRSKAELIAALS